MMRKIASRAPAQGTASIIDPSISYPERVAMALTMGLKMEGPTMKKCSKLAEPTVSFFDLIF